LFVPSGNKSVVPEDKAAAVFALILPFASIVILLPAISADTTLEFVKYKLLDVSVTLAVVKLGYIVALTVLLKFAMLAAVKNGCTVALTRSTVKYRLLLVSTTFAVVRNG
jgi:hypothetical protein